MTFSYDTRCRKEGIIQNKYIILHIYTCDLNGGLPGKIVCPHIVLFSDCHNHRPVFVVEAFNAQHINIGLYPFNFSLYIWGCTPLTFNEVLCLMTYYNI